MVRTMQDRARARGPEITRVASTNSAARKQHYTDKKLPIVGKGLGYDPFEGAPARTGASRPRQAANKGRNKVLGGATDEA